MSPLTNQLSVWWLEHEMWTPLCKYMPTWDRHTLHTHVKISIHEDPALHEQANIFCVIRVFHLKTATVMKVV